MSTDATVLDWEAMVGVAACVNESEPWQRFARLLVVEAWELAIGGLLFAVEVVFDVAALELGRRWVVDQDESAILPLSVNDVWAEVEIAAVGFAGGAEADEDLYRALACLNMTGECNNDDC